MPPNAHEEIVMKIRRLAAASTLSLVTVGAVALSASPAQADTAWERTTSSTVQDTAWE